VSQSDNGLALTIASGQTATDFYAHLVFGVVVMYPVPPGPQVFPPNSNQPVR